MSVVISHSGSSESRRAAMISKWDARFMAMSKLVSTWSKDQSAQVGCVIVTTDRRILSGGVER